MKRAYKLLSLVGLSSGYVMAGACTFTDGGFSMLPNITLQSIPIIGTLLT